MQNLKKAELKHNFKSIFLKVGGIRWPVFFNEHVILPNVLQHIALD